MKKATQVEFFERAKKAAFQLLVLAALALIGLWGHHTHWSFAPSRSDGASESNAERDLDSKAAPTRDQPVAQVMLGSSPDTVCVEFPTPESVRDLGIEMVAPSRRNVSREITASAAVGYIPSRMAQLSSRVPGTLWRLERRTGDVVRAGDVLAVIDSPSVGKAKADFLTAIADVELKKKAHDRLQAFGQGEVARKQVEEAETELRKARVELFNSQQALISLGLTVKLEEWQSLSEAELEQRIKFLGVPDSIVSGLDPDATTATLLPLCAPFDGIVIGHSLAKGEVVSPDQTQFQLADVSRMWIVLDVREQDAEELEIGQPVTFTAGAVTVNSSLSWISTEVDAKTRTVEVRCIAENPPLINEAGQPTGQRLLRANQFGLGRVRVHQQADALVIPTKAVQRCDGSPVAFVQCGDRSFEARKIQVGVVTEDFTEVVEGLEGTQPVVCEGSHVLKAELQRRYTASSAP